MTEKTDKLTHRRPGSFGSSCLGAAGAVLLLLGAYSGEVSGQEPPAPLSAPTVVTPGEGGWVHGRPPVIRTSSGGEGTRIIAAFDIRQRGEELFPRSRSLVAAVSSLTGDSSVCKGDFEAAGMSATMRFSTSRPSPFDEIEPPRYVEVYVGYLKSYVDYTDSFMYLLDDGGDSGFGRQAREYRMDASVSTANRMHSKNLTTARIDGHLLFGIHALWLTSDTRGADLAKYYSKQVFGPALGVREVFSKKLANDQTFELVAEFRYTVNMMSSGRITYYPAGSSLPYPLYVDAISDVQSLKLGARYGKLGGNLSLELSWGMDMIGSGGSVDEERVYHGITFAGVYHF